MEPSPAVPALGTQSRQHLGPLATTHRTYLLTLLLTQEEEADLSNPSSPSIAEGTAGYCRRESHWGQGLPDRGETTGDF